MGIKKGDTLRFYHPNLTTALSSVANAANHMRSFKKGSTTSSDKQEVFGGIIFTYFGRGEPLFGQPNVDSSPFLDNCPSMTLGGTYSGWVLGRGDLNMYATESREEKAVRTLQEIQVLAATLLAATSKKSPLKVWIRVKGFTKDLDRCLII
ncbi:hypothetical protein HanXRQr2_Chr04g0145611 [Helianthus annuus]|uniref:Uncharacterized protein n=1 Tax=Helianthus annuus TaxID=4232 RepID=A0A251UX21_HELAN|nr:hypothetical protein HanXRQr2_Chr04g0145611 [Helianthus annuus]KAJ0579637.1 hypothetical protein HanHA300_Chr04g0120131 [Helianthus annuus]KAJ0595533.1 hypothetical protein HanHA89_Chr04g0132391 [Helianthus annuus]KAJ0929701.1 hypothetical protein HanPSC8_Chr04g0140681 [Helianthus annuus]